MSVSWTQVADKFCLTGVKASKPNAWEFFLMSAIAKLGATILTYPILLVKSRLMAASKHTHADLQYNGTYDALRRIYRKEGISTNNHSSASLYQHASLLHCQKAVVRKLSVLHGIEVEHESC